MQLQNHFKKNLIILFSLFVMSLSSYAFEKGACLVVSSEKSRSPANTELKAFPPGSIVKVLQVGKKRLKVSQKKSWREFNLKECAQSQLKENFDHTAWIDKTAFEKIYLWDELRLENAKDQGTHSRLYKSHFLEVHFDNETLEATLFSYKNRYIFKGRPERFQIFITGLPDYPMMIRTIELDQMGTEIVYAGPSGTLSKDFSSQWTENNTQTGGINIKKIDSKGFHFESRWHCLDKYHNLSLKEGRFVSSNSHIELKPKSGTPPQFKVPFQITEKYQAVPGDKVKVIGFNEEQDKIQILVIPSNPQPKLTSQDLSADLSYSQLYQHISADFSCS